MSLREFESVCKEIAERQKNAGKAAQGRIEGRSVNVEGRLYPFDVAVPITIHDGLLVWVHISDNRAVVIGG